LGILASLPQGRKFRNKPAWGGRGAEREIYRVPVFLRRFPSFKSPPLLPMERKPGETFSLHLLET
jgi:hypothetical protein